LKGIFTLSAANRLRAGLIGICSAVILNAAVVYYNVARIVEANEWVTHALKVEAQLEDLLGRVIGAETAERGYAITGGDIHEIQYRDAATAARRNVAELRNLMRDNPEQLRRLDIAASRIEEKISFMDGVMQSRRDGGQEAAMQALEGSSGPVLMERVRSAVTELHREEDRLLAAGQQAAAANVGITFIGLGLFTLGALFLALLVFHFIRREWGTRQNFAEQLHKSNEMLRLVLDNIPQRVFWKTRELTYAGCNMAFARDACLAHPRELVGKTDRDMVWRDVADAYREDDAATMEANAAKLNYEERQARPDGSSFWLRTSKIPLHDATGAVTGILGTYEDITDAKQKEARLRIMASAIESSVNGIFITDAAAHDNPVLYVNGACESITGYAAHEMIGRNCRFLQNADMHQDGIAALRHAIAHAKTCQVVLRNYRKDGQLFWNELSIGPVRDEHGAVTHYVGILNDITAKVSYQEQLAREANYDSLTGLPNRNLLADRLGRALSEAAQSKRQVGVMMVGLDNFSLVNNSAGHAAGDRILMEMAQRLTASVGDTDTVARYGGDVFAVVLRESSSADALSALMERLLAAVSAPTVIEGNELSLTCSVGATLYPQDGTETAALIANADAALYRAKDAGRNAFQFFEREMTTQITERMTLEKGMRLALERNEFELHYQPKLDLLSGCISGAEALIRWRHPVEGMIPPGRFIQAAEESGLIVPIGEWVLRTACIQWKAWLASGLCAGAISVNLSARQMKKKGFPAWVDGVLKGTGLESHHLELEITEGLLFADTAAVIGMLDDLKALGVQMSIDDFGTGYSSLSYLKRLPVDTLKIDQSFVRDIPGSRDDMAIARAVIALAGSLDLKVIAEGVETREQMDFLIAQRCNGVQGYYFSRPLAPEDFERFVQARTARGVAALD
jgi:diguanylate cyclase (GGDEF)-like protein/PAS domain S-box-containing protein